MIKQKGNCNEVDCKTAQGDDEMFKEATESEGTNGPWIIEMPLRD